MELPFDKLLYYLYFNIMFIKLEKMVHQTSKFKKKIYKIKSIEKQVSINKP